MRVSSARRMVLSDLTLEPRICFTNTQKYFTFQLCLDPVVDKEGHGRSVLRKNCLLIQLQIRPLTITKSKARATITPDLPLKVECGKEEVQKENINMIGKLPDDKKTSHIIESDKSKHDEPREAKPSHLKWVKSDIQPDVLEENVSCKIEIPDLANPDANLFGRIIGKGRGIINQIQNDTATSIEIFDARRIVDLKESYVSIYGPNSISVEAAASRIRKIVEKVCKFFSGTI